MYNTGSDQTLVRSLIKINKKGRKVQSDRKKQTKGKVSFAVLKLKWSEYES